MDRFIGGILPTRRYRCTNSKCDWEGRKVKALPKVIASRKQRKVTIALLITGLGSLFAVIAVLNFERVSLPKFASPEKAIKDKVIEELKKEAKETR
jgi:hypothetical protein